MDVIDSYFHAVNQEDWSLLSGLWCQNAVLSLPTLDRKKGIDEITAYYPSVLSNYTHHLDKTIRRIVDGQTSVVEIYFTGRTDIGTVINFPAVDIFDIRDKKIMKLAIWYNVRNVIRQLERPRRDPCAMDNSPRRTL